MNKEMNEKFSPKRHFSNPLVETSNSRLQRSEEAFAAGLRRYLGTLSILVGEDTGSPKGICCRLYISVDFPSWHRAFSQREEGGEWI